MRRIAVALAISFSARAAEAACQRPADVGGFGGYDYAPATPKSFDGTNVRIWYVTTGPHAVNDATTRMDMVPDNVARAAVVGDDALAKYAKMGFVPPVSDGTCGGDSKLDIYLVHFTAADGDETAETCTSVGKASKCSSFGLVEARMENAYGTFDLGARTVIPHELFHATQDAYDQNVGRFWAEGSAQWATKKIDPTVMDLEAFLPAFFKSAGTSIDISTGGVTGQFIYGSAIWPVFLDEHVGQDTIRAGLEQEGMLGAPSMDAISAALDAAGTSLADQYPTFMAWNAATGSRAGTGGYKSAKTYPTLDLTAFPDTNEVKAIATGFSAFFYSFDFSDPLQLVLEGDPTRVGARAFPLDENGKASLDKLTALPAVFTGPGVVIVTGISSKKTDAPFTLKAITPPVADAGADAGTTPPPPMSGGCSCNQSSATGAPSAILLALALLRKRRR